MMMHDAVIMRTIIDLPEEQVRALAEVCRKRKISRAEAVRQAVGAMLDRERITGREAAFGAWAKGKDSREIVAKLRSEWQE